MRRFTALLPPPTTSAGSRREQRRNRAMDRAGVRRAVATPRLDTILPWNMPQFLAGCEPRPPTYEDLARTLWKRSVVEDAGGRTLP
eukprot:1166644-Alexandrium_andersonii.AAC.1